jgi:hypothetical protein
MFLVDIDKCHIVAGAPEAAADNPADGSGANDDHARAHMNLREDFCRQAENIGSIQARQPKLIVHVVNGHISWHHLEAKRRLEGS